MYSEAAGGAGFWELRCRLVALTQRWLLSVLAASTFPLLPGGSAIPLALAARAGLLLKQQERSLNSAAPCCCVAPAIVEQAWGDGPAGHPLPTDLPTFTLVFCTSLSYRAGPAMLLGPSGPIYPLASPIRDANYHFFLLEKL